MTQSPLIVEKHLQPLCYEDQFVLKEALWNSWAKYKNCNYQITSSSKAGCVETTIQYFSKYFHTDMHRNSVSQHMIKFISCNTTGRKVILGNIATLLIYLHKKSYSKSNKVI